MDDIKLEKSKYDDFSSLLPQSWKKVVHKWLDEDIPSFDYGGYVVGSNLGSATLYGKSPGVLAGVPFFEEIFKFLGCKVEWILNEGDEFSERKIEIAKVYGPICNILRGERTALNLISRASGIATKARRLLRLCEKNNFKGKVAGTRKTTPGFRLVEKYAMIVGGVDTHRIDLSSAIMLKDNHIAACNGSIKNAIEKVKRVSSFTHTIEVECGTEEAAIEAFSSGAYIVMLDNFKPTEFKSTASRIKQLFPNSLIEASGEIKEENITEYFCNDVDIISMGTLTGGIGIVDYSLKLS